MSDPDALLSLSVVLSVGAVLCLICRVLQIRGHLDGTGPAYIFWCGIWPITLFFAVFFSVAFVVFSSGEWLAQRIAKIGTPPSES